MERIPTETGTTNGDVSKIKISLAVFILQCPPRKKELNKNKDLSHSLRRSVCFIHGASLQGGSPEDPSHQPMNQWLLFTNLLVLVPSDVQP